MKAKSSIFGVLLIALGTVLLLDRLEVISFGWGKIFWMFLGVWGAVLAVQGVSMKRRGRIFWGSLFFFLGMFFSLEAWELVWLTDELGFGGISLALGLAFLTLYVFEPHNLGALVPALLFGSFGLTMILVEYGYLSWWEVRRFLRVYWPVALILWGVAILMRKRPAVHSKSESGGGQARS